MQYSENILKGLRVKMKGDPCISSGMLFWHTLVGSFRIAVPIAASQKT
jgi:hypothetical protein